MESVPKIREIWLDEEINDQEFVGIINSIYKQECYIYAIIPEWEEELLAELSNDFVVINKIPFPLTRIFPRTMGYVGYIKDSNKQFVFEFYLLHSTIDFLVFSDTNASQYLNNINKKNIDIYKIFESNKIPHITIGPDGQWLNVFHY
ncbi:hypothetical protein [Fictibacillus barbaricus]|uniref:Uncharacterized protein n=1 Tax=Fictibacillus barbaricus TaxID=182136 RepID=A0ABS2ZKL1_9BACL|nr:hypothetical protein [Fictibacillus barbaricus]MBN3547971.1 hypothetical protein [Fictibacillus barbaricus]GGB52969.1 hypothetical protein GCM10007199_18550 [Fictibacillus barbaricus]